MFRKIMLVWLLTVCFVAGNAQNIQWDNGQWFNGKEFVRKTWYTANNTLTEKKPAKVDTVINLHGQFVVAPFGEAHNHCVEQGFSAPGFIKTYLNHGIFYFKNPNSIPAFLPSVASLVNSPTSIDIVYANGGLTGSMGHPTVLYKRLLESGYKYSVPKWTQDSLSGQAYHIIDNETQLEEKWPNIIAQKPGFIKTYLLYSEEYDQRRSDSSGKLSRGLDPDLLPKIVQKAHSAHLKVSTHIETATDFRNAVRAGVDEVNHLPGYNLSNRLPVSAYVISEEDAITAGKKNMFAVATYSLILGQGGIGKADSVLGARKTQVDIQKKNLQMLHKHGVRIAFGCDSYMETSLKEAMYIHALKIFSNLELIRMWCENTAAAIFPNRKISQLKEGYEASFLVLRGNPLDDFNHVKEIQMKVKEGRIL